MSPNEAVVADVRRLMQQIQAGVLLLEELQDDDDPDRWFLPVGKRRGSPTALRYAWGQLHIAWINLSSYLMRSLDQEPWTIPPLQSRDTDGKHQTWEWGPEGQMEFVSDVAPDFDLRTAPEGLVRVIPPSPEPRYTLEEAKRILEICQTHEWDVETSTTGTPVAVRCKNCQETRAVT